MNVPTFRSDPVFISKKETIMRPDQSSTAAFIRTWRPAAPAPAPKPAPAPPAPRILTADMVAEQGRQIDALMERIAALEPAPTPATAVEEIARLQRAAALMEREHLEGRATLEQVEAIRRATSAKIDLTARAIQKRDGVSYADAVARLTRATP
jgi:hypothetical protein